jgi:hypothetical protein
MIAKAEAAFKMARSASVYRGSTTSGEYQETCRGAGFITFSMAARSSSYVIVPG